VYTKKPLHFVVDYSKPTKAVYKEAMASMLIGSGTLTILSRVQSPSAMKVVDLPSWVVDFSTAAPRPFLDLQLLAHPCAPYGFFDAARSRSVGFRIKDSTLHLHCFVLAIVTHIGDSSDDGFPKGLFERTAEMILARTKYTSPERQHVDDLWRTMLCDFTSLDRRRTSEDELRSAYRALLEYYNREAVLLGHERNISRTQTLDQMQNQERLAKLDVTGTIPSQRDPEASCQRVGLLEHGFGVVNYSDHDRLWQESQPFPFVYMRTMCLRRVFLLDNGALGVGPGDTQPGDELCVIADGGRTPFIMRRTENEDPNCRILIGEAYVRGIMYGEAVIKMEKEGKTWQEVCLI